MDLQSGLSGGARARPDHRDGAARATGVGYAEAIHPNARTWTSYGLLVATAYLLYGIGYVTPYLRADLGLSEAAAALPNSASAVGMIVAGLAAGPLQGRLGATTATRLWVTLVGVAAVGLAWAPAYPALLASAVAFGFGSGALLAHVNHVLGADTPQSAETHVARANVWAMVGGLAAPAAIAAAASSVAGGRAALLLPVPLFAVLVVLVSRSFEGRPADGRPHAAGRTSMPPTGAAPGHGRLPIGYWIAWAFTVLVVSLEFEFVVFGASLVAARAGVTVTVATGLASAFVAGELLGRLALGAGLGRRIGARAKLQGGLGLVVVAAALLFVASDQTVTAAAFLAGGLGVATLYPLAVVMSLAQAPGAPVMAATRLSLASGGGILGVPLVLGGAAQLAGLATAWLLVPATALAAVALLNRVPRDPADASPANSPG